MATTLAAIRSRDADEVFVAGLRAFLGDHHPGQPPWGSDARLAGRRRWSSTLFDHGWAGPAWPRRWGGMDLPLARQVLYHREFTRARVPRHPNPNLGTVGPTLILHGTPDQQERFLRPMLRGDELWAQGFSEPDAGSDLTSLQCRADRDGDDYVINGTKVWSTMADVAEWMFLLVRTGPPNSGRDGITYLLVDLSTPGIEVRPIRDLTGESGFCEVYFDAVRFPVSNRVGPENGGWALARTSLGHERSAASAGRAHSYEHVVHELIELASQLGATNEPVIRQRLADAWIGARLLALTADRSLAAVVRHGQPGPESSIGRLVHAQFEQRLHELAMDALGARSLVSPAEAAGGHADRWAQGFLRTRGSTIGAGTSEVQRNTIAERVLRLPREPRDPVQGGNR